MVVAVVVVGVAWHDEDDEDVSLSDCMVVLGFGFYCVLASF